MALLFLLTLLSPSLSVFGLSFSFSFPLLVVCLFVSFPVAWCCVVLVFVSFGQFCEIKAVEVRDLTELVTVNFQIKVIRFWFACVICDRRSINDATEDHDETKAEKALEESKEPQNDPALLRVGVSVENSLPRCRRGPAVPLPLLLHHR